MGIKTREVRTITVIDVDGNVDINSSDIIEAVAILVNSGKLNIILNLEKVEMIDYSGVSVLAIAYKKVINNHGKMKLVHVPPAAIELLRVVKLESVFEIYAVEEDAVRSYFSDKIDELHLRRKFKRLDMHFHVYYRVADGPKTSKSYFGEALNISAAGLYIYTHDTLPLDTHIEMEFSLPDTKSELTAPGKVIYIGDKELQPHAYPGMGVSFSHLTQEKERIIADFIDKNISSRADEQ